MLKLNQTVYGPLTCKKSMKHCTTDLFECLTNTVGPHETYSCHNGNKCCYHVRQKKPFFVKILTFFIFYLFHGHGLATATFTAIIATVTLAGWKDIYFISISWILHSLWYLWETDKLALHIRLYIKSNFHFLRFFMVLLI